MTNKWIAMVALLAAGPALAQSRVGSVRESPFEPGTARIYDNQERFIGTARRNAFIPGRTDLYDATGRSTGVELRENPFERDRIDVFRQGTDRKR